MPLFADWCQCAPTATGQKRLLKFTERPGGRSAISNMLRKIMRSHYDDAQRVAEDIAELGYEKTAALLAQRMPRSARARSGEFGEILATELTEENLGYRVPVRRLRYKDGREMALRGDDFIGITLATDGSISYAKGESKSRATLSKDAIDDARLVLSRDAGRPTPTSILFVADRLMDLGGDEERVGRMIRNDVANGTVSPSRIEHVLFTISGNATPKAIEDDLAASGADRPQTSIHMQISDHQSFIKNSYEEAVKLGDD